MFLWAYLCIGSRWLVDVIMSGSYFRTCNFLAIEGSNRSGEPSYNYQADATPTWKTQMTPVQKKSDLSIVLVQEQEYVVSTIATVASVEQQSPLVQSKKNSTSPQCRCGFIAESHWRRVRELSRPLSRFRGLPAQLTRTPVAGLPIRSTNPRDI